MVNATGHDSDGVAVSRALKAALEAGAQVIQSHVGSDEKGQADLFFEPFLPMLREMFAAFLVSERQLMNDDDTVDQALRRAILAVEKAPVSEHRHRTLRWLQDILDQKGCENWGYVEGTATGTEGLTIRVERTPRLADLIALIIRG